MFLALIHFFENYGIPVILRLNINCLSLSLPPPLWDIFYNSFPIEHLGWVHMLATLNYSVVRLSVQVYFLRPSFHYVWV